MQRKESAAPAWKNLPELRVLFFYVVDSEMCIKKRIEFVQQGESPETLLNKSSQKNNNVITLIKRLIKDNT